MEMRAAGGTRSKLLAVPGALPDVRAYTAVIRGHGQGVNSGSVAHASFCFAIPCGVASSSLSVFEQWDSDLSHDFPDGICIIQLASFQMSNFDISQPVHNGRYQVDNGQWQCRSWKL